MICIGPEMSLIQLPPHWLVSLTKGMTGILLSVIEVIVICRWSL